MLLCPSKSEKQKANAANKERCKRLIWLTAASAAALLHFNHDRIFPSSRGSLSGPKVALQVIVLCYFWYHNGSKQHHYLRLARLFFYSADVLNRFKVSVCASVLAGCEGAITHSGWGKRQRRQLEEGGRVNLQIAGPKEISTPQLKKTLVLSCTGEILYFPRLGSFISKQHTSVFVVWVCIFWVLAKSG